MLRLLAVLLVPLLAAPAFAQAPADGVQPGTRVRVFLSSDVLPPAGAVFTGVLQTTGDTLTVATDEGNTIRVRPGDLTGFDVSAGRPSFPYWLPAVGAAVGLAVGYPLGRDISGSERCNVEWGVCWRDTDTAKTYFVVGIGVAVGALVGTYVGTRLASERWESRRVRVAATGAGVAVAVRL